MTMDWLISITPFLVTIFLLFSLFIKYRSEINTLKEENSVLFRQYERSEQHARDAIRQLAEGVSNEKVTVASENYGLSLLASGSVSSYSPDWHYQKDFIRPDPTETIRPNAPEIYFYGRKYKLVKNVVDCPYCRQRVETEGKDLVNCPGCGSQL